ncbi:glycosyltransferase family 39 protein [Fulvivirgaceae bacterium BMA10]|uniref:Glycosyltransferase family 39 protein n=1 Tax=Splendidivirga corallicola TaxID=3051826 RepID=A0ABT8KVY0_9BACT|nr:glycosyltransferase family 39 protein [Fulvivirgaceae bacterium BMA10]
MKGLQAISWRSFVFLTISLLLVVYFWGLGLNDIWNPNEAFYADATREMFERNNFLEFFYNAEHRFNKPPMTYWVIALSASVFGLNEFAIRFPIAMMAVLTIWLTYLIGKKIYDRRVGTMAAVIMALSAQFTANARYATPEIPLTFFFTLTLYLFIRGYSDKDFRFLLLSYFAFGLTILTKGYPYLIVIGAIMVSYLFFHADFNIKKFWKELGVLRIHIGLPIVLIIGFSWPMYMYWKYEGLFLDVLNAETMERALSYDSKGFEDIFYYLIISTWGFFPYSLAFFVALGYYLYHYKQLKQIAFAFVWFGVMLVIFTAAKGKLPTYFIQAHTALSLITAKFLVDRIPVGTGEKFLWHLSLWFPGILVSILNGALIYWFEFHWILYLLVVIPFISWLLLIPKRPSLFQGFIKIPKDNHQHYWGYLKLFPFITFLLAMVLFSVGMLPRLETLRPYEKIGEVLQQKQIPKDVPLLIEHYFFHNMPYYARRNVEGYLELNHISDYSNEHREVLALVHSENEAIVPGAEVLWTGLMYRRGSEAKFFKFLGGYIKTSKGDYSDYRKLSLIYRNEHNPQKDGRRP